jgi:hypothetical protein
VFTPTELEEAIIRLEDAGCVTRVPRQPYTAYPPRGRSLRGRNCRGPGPT